MAFPGSSAGDPVTCLPVLCLFLFSLPLLFRNYAASAMYRTIITLVDGARVGVRVLARSRWRVCK